MGGGRMKLAAAVYAVVVVTTLAQHHRRSISAPSLPVSKGGWRPVIGSSNLPGYGLFGAAPLHSAAYKIPVPVINTLPTSARPVATRDANKLTSIAQAYRPTTYRTLPASNDAPNAPINTYFNPFSLPNTGMSHYKIVQNFPMENVVIRNPYTPYAARPVITKLPTKYKQNLHSAMFQQLNNLQTFGIPPYPTTKNPHDIFSKPVEVYAKPTDKVKNQPTKMSDMYKTEIYKTEVFKLPDSDPAPQSINQQKVKTAQQSLPGTLNPPTTSYQHYPYKDDKFAPMPPSILGTFNSFGIKTVKGRDPLKTTYLPPVPTKQTIFNSFSYMPTFKTISDQFVTTTPKFQFSNHVSFGSANFKILPTQQSNRSTPYKTDPNIGNRVIFKASPQDPFNKPGQYYHSNKQYNNADFMKSTQVTPYPHNIPTTTSVNKYYISDLASNRLPSSPPQSTKGTYYGQSNLEYNKLTQNNQGNSDIRQQTTPEFFHTFDNKNPQLESTSDSQPFKPTYEVTEIYKGDDVITQSSTHSWPGNSDSYDYKNSHDNSQFDSNPQLDAITNNKPTTTSFPEQDLPEEYAIVTEPNEKNYDNSLSYDTDIETQSRRPLGDDFEPIFTGKHKLKDYYYKVSTPSYNEHTTTQFKKPKKKPNEKFSESTTRHSEPNWEYTTHYNTVKDSIKPAHDDIENLPTIPPNKHFRRPNQEPLDKEKIRKRNKNRRRRPAVKVNSDEKSETNNKRQPLVTTENYNNDIEEVHTIRPRVRVPINSKSKQTTPSFSTDLSTSALPTLSPTIPTIIKKKIINRRPTTTPIDRAETTTNSNRDNDINKDSPIMKIANRSQYPRVTTATYEHKISEIPDYSHKQDEKDTPTSDISVNINGNKPDAYKPFSFHDDVKPIEAKTEPYTQSEDRDTTEITKDGKSNRTLENMIKDIDETTDSLTTNEQTENRKTENKTSELSGRVQRPRLKNKYDNNRPRFSVKDYRNRLSSTTTTEKATEQHVPKLRYPQRRLPFNENKFNTDNENTTEGRKKFIPKDARHKISNADDYQTAITTERDIQTKLPVRQKSSTVSTEVSTSETTTQKNSQRSRNSSRREPQRSKQVPDRVDVTNHAPVHIRKPVIRKKIKDMEDSVTESSHDNAVTETTSHYDHRGESSSEKIKSESSIMKIAKDDKKHQIDHIDHIFEHSKRVSDLTLAASKDYNTPGLFKTVSPNSRRIPNYFTIATDDPILPIEAFFPQLNQKKES